MEMQDMQPSLRRDLAAWVSALQVHTVRLFACSHFPPALTLRQMEQVLRVAREVARTD